MSGHTPGPWSVVNGHYPGFLEIKGPSFRLAIVTSATDIDINSHMQRIADARLIAAAPDLLEYHRQIKHSIQQARISGNDWRSELALIENMVDAAIVKATGDKA
jgi:hypothetical protein